MPPYWTGLLDEWMDRVVMATSGRIVANSERAVEVLTGGLGVKQEKCCAIHNGLDLEEFDRSIGKDIGFSGLPSSVDPERPAICAVANLRPVKRLDVLIRAFVRVTAKSLGCSLWLVGDGPSRKMLEGLARDLGVSSQVHFLGHRNEIPAILNLATLGVLCSDREGLSNAIVEYMAAGLPVVATDVGGNEELVVEGETGLLVPAGDSTALAEAILWLLYHPEAARQFGEAGRRRVEEQFTAWRMAKETERLYEELVSPDEP
jgi:glycosyltransferase involved in cell wall biosynthesis